MSPVICLWHKRVTYIERRTDHQQVPELWAVRRMTFSLSLTADDVGCDLPVTEPVSFHGPTIFSATEASPLLDPEYGMLYLQNSDTTSALDFLGANWSLICLSRALNHGALWHIVFLHFRNILTYSLTYFVVRNYTSPLAYYCCSVSAVSCSSTYGGMLTRYLTTSLYSGSVTAPAPGHSGNVITWQKHSVFPPVHTCDHVQHALCSVAVEN